jgi:hypothetical protein
MVSFELRQTLEIAARLLVLAAVAAPYAVFSQRELDPGASDEQRQIVEQILGAQAQGGPFSAESIDPLRELALVYEERGDHALASAVIEQARQLVRANYGLHSLDQAPLLRQRIHNEEVRGNFPTAWDLEQDLLTLIRRHPDDLRTIPIWREIGDRRMQLLDRYLAGERPPQIMLGCYRGQDIGSCHAGSREVAAQAILSEAYRSYGGAIRVFLRHEIYASDELRELEMELIRSSYEFGHYDVGRQSLRRLISYDVANSEPWLSRLNALIQMADWDLLFSPQKGVVLDTYLAAYEQLVRKGIEPQAIEQLFSPRIPVVLPTFLPSPLVSDETESSTGYIDVEFDLTKYGRSRRIEILDTTTNANDVAENELVRLIVLSRFRPRVTAGRLDHATPIVVRYYVNE